MKTCRSPFRQCRAWSRGKRTKFVPLCVLIGAICVLVLIMFRSMFFGLLYVHFNRDLKSPELPAIALLAIPNTYLVASTTMKHLGRRVQPMPKENDNYDSPIRPDYESAESGSAEPVSVEDFEAAIQEDERRIVPGLGDNGVAVELSGEEANRGEADMKREAYNIELSRKVAMNRSLPDARHPRCLEMKYPKNLPTVSVIIIFTDESLSVLLRTIHSVINRSPPRYLNEIILVDDFSTFGELKGKLDYYIKTRLPKYVKLFRQPRRLGLIKARLKGAREASGEVLLFLDAHCEATDGWLQPILARIKEDRKNVVVPIIDSIDARTMAYEVERGNYDFQLGSFTWGGSFTWIPIPKEDREKMRDLASPVRTPTMAGGLFAMNRKYFYELGSYDEQMDLWGGENLEISFRIWQCGARLETVPCSRVGHMFRDFHSYLQRSNKDSHGINTARMAKVWWDEYDRLFFRNRQDLLKADIGDLTDRVKLRKRLQCRPFSWFLQEILPTKYVPDENVKAYGWVKVSGDVCLDIPYAENEDEDRDLGFYPCNIEPSESQSLSLSNNDELRNEFLCAQVINNGGGASSVRMVDCDGSPDQKWHYTKEGFLLHVASDMCMDAKKYEGHWISAKVNHCRPSRKTQLWAWQSLYEEPGRSKKKAKKPVVAQPE